MFAHGVSCGAPLQFALPLVAIDLSIPGRISHLALENTCTRYTYLKRLSDAGGECTRRTLVQDMMQNIMSLSEKKLSCQFE